MMQLKSYNHIYSGIILSLAIIIGSLLIIPHQSPVVADSIDELEERINQKSDEIRRLDEEIAAQRAKLREIGSEKTTLQSTINQLETSRSKIQNDISRTETLIDRTQLEISKLENMIGDQTGRITEHRAAVASTIKDIDRLDDFSLIERILSQKTIADFWEEQTSVQLVQKNFQEKIDMLLTLRDELEFSKLSEKEKQDELASYQIELVGERQSIEAVKEEQDELLEQTEQQESTFQQSLAQKVAQKQAFEQEILKIESQIKLLIDPNSYPEEGHGVLGWILDAPRRVTQHFGGSQFAANNPSVYGRPFHPGTDFGIPIGTKIYSAASGTVRDTGNTDAFAGCYAWGKWVLIDHDNGLSTLYAHLSSILVSPGQRVERGERIALSGNSGISTGPHLHLTLYASQGVQVSAYNNPGSGCTAAGARGPFADLDAYLDPLEYLPECVAGESCSFNL
jgi:murein DD-endopeptidase MepM/ murein hydrolase activator NlpD